jgi:hypothetical protein
MSRRVPPSDATPPRVENEVPQDSENNGRDERGRFARGNRGGPGNPFARRTAAFRRTASEALNCDQIKALMSKLYEQAMSGDVAAARLILSYTAGRPEACPNPDELDLQEYQHFDREAKALATAGEVITSPDIAAVTDIIHAGRPSANATLTNGLRIGLERLAEEDRAAEAEEEAYVEQLRREREAKSQGGAVDEMKNPAEMARRVLQENVSPGLGPDAGPHEASSPRRQRSVRGAGGAVPHAEASARQPKVGESGTSSSAYQGERGRRSAPIGDGDNGGAAAPGARGGAARQEPDPMKQSAAPKRPREGR